MGKRIIVIARPNSPKTEIKDYNKEKNIYKVNIKAPPEKGKANLEVVKFFSKLLKKKTRIVSGLKTKKKLLEIK